MKDLQNGFVVWNVTFLVVFFIKLFLAVKFLILLLKLLLIAQGNEKLNQAFLVIRV